MYMGGALPAWPAGCVGKYMLFMYGPIPVWLKGRIKGWGVPPTAICPTGGYPLMLVNGVPVCIAACCPGGCMLRKHPLSSKSTSG